VLPQTLAMRAGRSAKAKLRGYLEKPLPTTSFALRTFTGPYLTTKCSFVTNITICPRMSSWPAIYRLRPQNVASAVPAGPNSMCAKVDTNRPGSVAPDGTRVESRCLGATDRREAGRVIIQLRFAGNGP
jgi:hypothetical protein